MAKKRLVSGMRTTGSLHLGHLEGTLRTWVKLQEQYDCYFFAAVWHAFTDRLKIDELPRYITDMVVDFMSVGIDPEKSVIFRQSAMPQHAELNTILSMYTPLGWLERCPTFKDQVRDEAINDYTPVNRHGDLIREEPGLPWFTIYNPETKVGAWLTNRIVIVNVCGALVSTPPFAVPPSSRATSVIVAEPFDWRVTRLAKKIEARTMVATIGLWLSARRVSSAA